MDGNCSCDGSTSQRVEIGDEVVGGVKVTGGRGHWWLSNDELSKKM
ncbi:hypothetical protein A2U01_0002377, partial [Trifolium medium]|nr:hypothetical protein [Trifolium medium]